MLSMLAAAGTASAQTAQFSGAIATLNSGFSFGGLQRVAVDRNGNIYVTDGNNNEVKEILAAGGYTTANILGSGFNGPTGVAVDGSGNVYVADFNNSAVKEILAAGGYTTVNTLGSGFSAPAGVAVDGSGNVYVADTYHNAVKEILAAGGYTTVNTLGGGFYQPYGIGVDGSGNVYVADSGHNAVKEILAAGGYTTVNTLGSGFYFPTGVAVDGSGNVYVADQGNNAVKEILAAGGYTTVNTLGGGFNNPTGVAVDGSGNVYVADQNNNAVKEIMLKSVDFFSVPVGTTSSTRTLTFTFTAGGTIGAPQVLTMGAPNLDFTDAGTGSCTTNGTTHTYNAGDTCTVDVAFKPLYPGQRLGAVQLISSAGTPIVSALVYGTGTGPLVTFPSTSVVNTLGSGFSNPTGVAVDGKGDVFVDDSINRAIKEIVAGTGGNAAGVVSSSSTVITLASGLGYPRGIAVDGSGDVIFGDFLNHLVKEIVAGTGGNAAGVVSSSSTVNVVGSGFNLPDGIAVDGSGNVFVADARNSSIREIVAGTGGNAAGEVSSASTVISAGSGFNSPEGIAVDGSGNVFVGDTNNNAVKEIEAGTGGNAAGMVSSTSTVITIGSGFALPVQLAVDGNGDVLVSDYNHNAIKEIVAGTGGNAAGVVSSASTVITLGSGFSHTYGVAADGSGNVFVADDGHSLVKEIPLSAAPAHTFPTSTAIGNTDTTDGPFSVTVANSGNATLTFPLPTSGANPSVSPSFTWDNASTCNQTNSGSSAAFTLAPGASCTLEAEFAPQMAGSIIGSVVLTDDHLNAAAPNYATQTISLTGTATGPVLSLSKSHVGTFTQGSTAQWMIVVSNTAASGTTVGTVTVTDTLPTGYTLASYTSTSGLWTCSGLTSVTCTGSPDIAGGNSSTINLTVNVPANSPTSVNNTAYVYGGGDVVHTSPATAAISNTDVASVAVLQTTTTLSIGVSSTSSTYGQPVTLTATLAPYTAQGNSSNGEAVTFYSGTTNLGTGTLTNGVATLTTTTLPVGADSLTAVYAGDTYLTASTTTTPAAVAVAALTFTVTSIADNGTGTLRAALGLAASDGGGNIVFSPTVFATPQTITLSSGTLTIPANTTITGPTSGSGATLSNLVTVSGNNAYTIFTVNSGVTGASIANLNITGGTASDVQSGTPNRVGGGIDNAGTLTVIGGVFSSDVAGTVGGGIYNTGTLTVTNSTFSRNTAQNGGGGGILNDSTGTMTVTGSTFSTNSATAGGGIFSLGTAMVTNSTFSGNTATNYGGGVAINGGTLTVAESTLSNNTATIGGGGVFIFSGTLNLANSIDSGNTASANTDISGSYNNNGGNVIGNSSIELASLANYGGTMQTMIPLPGSPAICAGLKANILSGVTTDQRGEPNTNTSYPGYNSMTPCVDAGSVQTNYAVSFTQQPSNVVATEAMAPAPTVTLDESGAPFTQAVTIPLTLSGNGTLGGGSATIVSGVATYSNLSVSATGSGDTLTATLSINPNLATPLSLTATSNSFNVTTGVTATLEISAAYLTENYTVPSFTPVAGSGGSGTLTYSILPSLPTGLSFNASTGAISGEATVASSSTTYTVTITDQNSATASQTFTLTVNGLLQATQAIASKSLTANITSPSFTPVTGAGGTGTLTYSISPSLPAGLNFNTSTGAISGTSTIVSAATSYTVTVTDANHATAAASFTLTVDAAVVATQAIASETLTYNTAASFTPVTGSSGTAPLSYSVSPVLPAGLSLNASTGTITGTPNGVQTTTSYTITITDTNGGSAAASFAITVNKATPMIAALPSASAISYGQTLVSSVLSGGSATYSGVAVVGSFAWAAPATAPGAGTQTESVTFTPTDTVDYYTVTGTVSLTVNQATPVVTWSAPAAISYGTALSAAQLNATANYNGAAVAGTFSYSPAAGTVLSDGSHTLSVSFTPTDTTNYTTPQPVAVSLMVTGDALTVTANNATRVYGTGNPVFTGAVTGAANGDTFTESYTTTATQSSGVGSYAIVPSVTGANLSNYTVSATNGTLTITQASSATTPTASASSVAPGQSVTLTATVADATANSTGTPSGTVTFFDGTTQLGTATLNRGVAAYSTTALVSGTHALSAVYSGDANFTGSNASLASAVVITPLDFTLGLNGIGSQTVAPGGAANYTFQIAPLYGSYPASVSFSATGLPPGATVTFSPQNIPANGGAQTVTMTIQTAPATAKLEGHGSGYLLALLVVPMLGLRRRGRMRLVCVLFVVLGGAAALTTLTGCGAGNGFFTQSQQSYNLTVTAASGQAQHSATATLIVE